MMVPGTALGDGTTAIPGGPQRDLNEQLTLRPPAAVETRPKFFRRASAQCILSERHPIA